MDAWDPKTFSAEITVVLKKYSKLILDYSVEDRRLMNEHLRSSPYQSLKPNPLSGAYQELREYTLAPILARSRIRVWHYTRLTEEEANEMYERLVPSSLGYLRQRLNHMLAKELLTKKDAETILSQSPLHKQSNREGGLYATTIPFSHCYGGVKPLLESWGGESTYFWLTDKNLAIRLKNLGIPRVIEIETDLSDSRNGYMVSETVLNAWARQLGAPASLSGYDLFITQSIHTAKVIRIHTKGDGCFEAVAENYPEGVNILLDDSGHA